MILQVRSERYPRFRIDRAKGDLSPEPLGQKRTHPAAAPFESGRGVLLNVRDMARVGSIGSGGHWKLCCYSLKTC